MKTALGTYASRKIEQEMCEAVASRRTWQKDNTEVRVYVNNTPGREAQWAEIRLFGNVIATYYYDGGIGGQKTVVNEPVLMRWPTATTLSRLRALGAKVSKRKERIYLNDVEM